MTTGSVDDLFTRGPDGWRRLSGLLDDLIDAAGRHSPGTASTTRSSAAVRQAVEAWDLCPNEAVEWSGLVESFAATFVHETVDVTSPWTVAHLHCPTLTASAAAEALIGALNQSMDTYDQSPAATYLEDRVVGWLGAEMGLPETRSGVFTAGGTASNILAMTLAREHHARRSGRLAMDTGVGPDASRWRVLTSDQAHFSIAQAAAMLGLGRAAVIPVESDRRGVMRLDALDAELATCADQGLEPIAIVATAGTTDAGAFDPIAEVGRRARAVGAWFHVDAAVGSAFVLSDRFRPLLNGAEMADSVTTDFHKLWWQPIGASALLVRDVASFDTIREESHYLDRDVDVEIGVLNLVGRSLDTTRRSDVVKLVVGLSAVGRRQMASMLDHIVDLAASTAAEIDSRPDLELLRTPSTVMVLFRVAPQGVSPDRLDVLNTEVQRTLFDDGTAVLGRTQLDGQVALKLTVINPMATPETMAALLDEISARAAVIVGVTGRSGVTSA